MNIKSLFTLFTLIILFFISNSSEAKLTDLLVSGGQSATSTKTYIVGLDGNFDDKAEQIIDWTLALSTSSFDVTNGVSQKTVTERVGTLTTGISTRFDNQISIYANVRYSTNSDEHSSSTAFQVAMGHTYRFEDNTLNIASLRNKITLVQTKQKLTADSSQNSDYTIDSVWLSSRLKFENSFAIRAAYKNFNYSDSLSRLADLVSAKETTKITTAGYLSSLTSSLRSESLLEFAYVFTQNLELLTSANLAPSAYDSSQTTSFNLGGYYQVNSSYEVYATLTSTSYSDSSDKTTGIELGLSTSFE